MKHQKILTTCIALVLLLVLATQSLALDLAIDRVELDDQELSTTSVNRLDVDRDNTVEVEVRFTPTKDIQNVELMAFISGYEYNQNNRIFDTTPLFDADANVTYVKKLNLVLPDDVDEDNYRLRIVAADRNGDQLVQDYKLKLDIPRHNLNIRDVLVYPGTTVKGGDVALVTVRLDNQGEKNEDDVKVTVSVPELTVSASDFVDEIKSEKQEETEELFLRIPKCAEAGTYPLMVDVSYDNGHQSVTAEQSLDVTRNPACDEAKQPTVVVVQPLVQQPTVDVTPAAAPSVNKLRRALEIVLVGLLALLIIVGLIIGFAKLSSDED